MSVLNLLQNTFNQWRRNEFESGGTGPERKWGHRSGAKRRKMFFWSCPSTFLALKVQLVVLVSAFVMSVQFSQFLVRWSSTHGAPVPSHL